VRHMQQERPFNPLFPSYATHAVPHAFQIQSICTGYLTYIHSVPPTIGSVLSVITSKQQTSLWNCLRSLPTSFLHNNPYSFFPYTINASPAINSSVKEKRSGHPEYFTLVKIARHLNLYRIVVLQVNIQSIECQLLPKKKKKNGLSA